MADLTETAGWDSVPQLETTTPALGGPGGPMNEQAQALLNRTAYLGDEVNALKLTDYATLRAYVGSAKRVYITGYLVAATPSGISGTFVRDDADTTTVDDGGTVIVDALGRRWKRMFDGAANFKWWGAVGGGAIDDTVAAQAAFDACGLTAAEYADPSDDLRRAKLKLYIPNDTYLVEDLKIYQGSYIEWGPKAVFLLKSTATYGIKTVNRIGQAHANFGVEKPTLIRPRIDMAGYAVFGILYECAQMGSIIEPEVLNVPAGTGTYADPFNAAGTYDRCGIAIKGIHDVQGAYWNNIRKPRIKGVTSKGNTSIWMGTSAGGNNQRANENVVEGGYLRTCAIGVNIVAGGDNVCREVDASTCDIAFAVGATTGTTPCQRNKLYGSYVENCTTAGFRMSTNAEDTLIEGVASTSGTTTVKDDNGVNTIFRPYNSDFRLDKGEFTPVVFGTVSAGAAAAYSVQKGYIRRDDDDVWGWINVTWSGHTGTGNLRISGLPFQAITGMNFPVTIYASNLSLSASNVIAGVVSSGQSYISLLQMPVGGGAGVNVPMDADGTLYIGFHYKAAP